MVRKRQKTIGNYIIWILLAVGLIPLIVMVLATYDTTSDLLMARNDSAKLSAVNVVQTERSKLQKQSEHVLKKVAGYPEISGGKYDEKIIKTQLDRAKDACQYIQSIVVGYSDNKYVSTQLEPADYKVTSRSFQRQVSCLHRKVPETAVTRKARTLLQVPSLRQSRTQMRARARFISRERLR